MASADSSDGEPNPLLIVLSGPSGVGKDAILSRMREPGKPYHYTVTATTRLMRDGEQDGVDYIFHSVETFDAMIERGEFIEWAVVHGNRYGVPRTQVRDAMQRGQDVILKIDVQGAATIRKLAPEAVLIFVRASEPEELVQRLKQRKSETPDAQRLRLKNAETEMERSAEYDHVVVNVHGCLDDTIREIEGIVELERRRSPPRRVTI
jgi:guanylate kinase